MDKIDEKFLAQCIDNKATAYGRRHDGVLYLSHRVKKRDFIRIVNFSRDERKLSQIRFTSTVYIEVVQKIGGHPKYSMVNVKPGNHSHV